LVKVAKPEPSYDLKSSKTKGQRRSPEFNRSQKYSHVDLWNQCKLDTIKQSEEYQVNTKQICVSLVYKYRYTIKLGFEAFQNYRLENDKVKGNAATLKSL
jgi:hypothetical protein